jgi:hypothetical protein
MGILVDLWTIPVIQICFRVGSNGIIGTRASLKSVSSRNGWFGPAKNSVSKPNRFSIPYYSDFFVVQRSITISMRRRRRWNADAARKNAENGCDKIYVFHIAFALDISPILPIWGHF